MGLHLPEAPPPDSDEEEDPEGAAAQRSRASIPMDAGRTCPLWAPVLSDSVFCPPPPQQHQSLFTRLKSFLCPDITSCLPADHVELVKRTMAAVALPSLGVPSWAREISDEQWKDMVQNTLQSRQSASALRLGRRSNVSGP